MYRKFSVCAAFAAASAVLGFIAQPMAAQTKAAEEAEEAARLAGQPAGQTGARDYSKIQAAGVLATGQPVQDLAFSPNGRKLAALTFQQVYIWDTGTGTPLKPLNFQQSFARTIAWSPDSTMLVTGGGGQGGAIRVWDVEEAEPQRAFGEKMFVNRLAFSPDGKWLASASTDNKLRLWNIENGQELGAVEGAKFPITQIAFSADGQFLYTAGGGVGKMKEATDPAEAVGGLPMGPAGMPMGPVPGVYEGLTEFMSWSLQDGQLSQQVTLSDGGPGVAFSTDKKVLAVVGSGAVVKAGNQDAPGPPGRMGKTYWSNDTVRLWRIPGGPGAQPTELFLPEVLKNPAASLREKVAVTWSPDDKARVIDNMIWTGGTTAQPLPRGAINEFNAMAFSPDGRFLAGGGANGVQIWIVP